MKKDYQEQEVPKHRKRRQSKEHAIVFTYIGPPHRSELGRFLTEEKIQKYATKKAAMQALQAWKDGRAQLRPPTLWKCEYRKL